MYYKVIQNQEFLQLNMEQMKNLLSCDELNITCEEQVFHALMNWINFDPQNRREHIGYLLGFVKLPLLSPVFLADQVEPVMEGRTIS